MNVFKLFQLYNHEEFPSFMGVNIDNVNQSGLFGETLLSIAISRGAKEEVLVLLDAGADVNGVSENGNTPLHEAIGQKNLEIVNILLDRGALPSLKNDFDQNCFELAELMGIDLRR